MKNLFNTILVFALTCGIASAIGISWSATALELNENPVNTTGISPNYGTSLDDFVLQLVFVGDGTFDRDGNYKILNPIQTGTIPQIPFEQAGKVQGLANVNQAGTYVMLLYNNHGGYYALSDMQGGEQVANSSVALTGNDIDLGVGFETLTVTCPTYQGALVPEPSTAALALAGIALLFRRKRA